jgi:hypothetical protein
LLAVRPSACANSENEAFDAHRSLPMLQRIVSQLPAQFQKMRAFLDLDRGNIILLVQPAVRRLRYHTVETRLAHSTSISRDQENTRRRNPRAALLSPLPVNRHRERCSQMQRLEAPRGTACRPLFLGDQHSACPRRKIDLRLLRPRRCQVRLDGGVTL